MIKIKDLKPVQAGKSMRGTEYLLEVRVRAGMTVSDLVKDEVGILGEVNRHLRRVLYHHIYGEIREEVLKLFYRTLDNPRLDYGTYETLRRIQGEVEDIFEKPLR